MRAAGREMASSDRPGTRWREGWAKGGFHGTSTERIAERAGVSQPYLFRLFGTKKKLFLACVRAGFQTVRETFDRVSEGLSGEEPAAADAARGGGRRNENERD